MLTNKSNSKSDYKKDSLNIDRTEQLLNKIYKRDREFINACYFDILEKSFDVNLRLTKNSSYLFEISKKFINQALDSSYIIFINSFPDFTQSKKGQLSIEKFDYKRLSYKNGEYEASGLYKNGSISINMDYLIKDDIIAVKRAAKRYKSKTEFIEALRSGRNIWGNNLRISLFYLYSTVYHEVFHYLQDTYISPNLNKENNLKSHWLYIEGSASYFDKFMMNLIMKGPDVIPDKFKYQIARDVNELAKDLDKFKDSRLNNTDTYHKLGSAVFSIINYQLNFDLVRYLKLLKILSDEKKLSDGNLIKLIEKEYNSEFHELTSLTRLKR